MNIPPDRLWMYNRTNPNRMGGKIEYIDGVETFIKHASTLDNFIKEGVISCPCKKCQRKYNLLKPDDVRQHLYSYGFKPNYWYWTDHGEVAPTIERGGCSTRNEASGDPLSQYRERCLDAAMQDVAGEHMSDAPPPRSPRPSKILRGGRGRGKMGSTSRNELSTTRTSLPTTLQLPSTPHLDSTFEEDHPTSPIAEQCSHHVDDGTLLGAYEDPEYPPISKKYIAPAGDKDYVPNKDGTNAFTNVFKTRLKEPYHSWSKMPQVEKDSWFEDWKKFVCWDPQHEGHMYLAFMLRGGLRMKGHYYDIRSKGVKPNWMLESVYDHLCEYWNSEEFKSASNRNKVNRSSNAGKPNYAGGSQSVHTRIKIKETATKKKMNVTDIYRDNFIKKVDRDKPVSKLPEGKIRDDMINFNKLKAEQKRRLLKDPNYPAKTDDELWTEVQGGPNSRGQMLGLNHKRKASVVTGPVSSTPHSTSSNSVQELLQVIATKQEQLLSSITNLHQMFMMDKGKGKGKGKRKGKGKHVIETIVIEDDEGEEEED